LTQFISDTRYPCGSLGSSQWCWSRGVTGGWLPPWAGIFVYVTMSIWGVAFIQTRVQLYLAVFNEW